MCCKCCSVTQRKVWVFGCGTFIALLALILGLLWPTIYLRILYSELVLKEGSLNYQNWIETPIPIYLEINMFDWKNPNDLYKKNVKPIFEEKGPYVFLEKHTRVNLDWHKNSSISFNQIRKWHYVPEKSNGTLDDLITAPNVLTATVAYTVRDKPKAIRIFANYIVKHKGGSLYLTKSVREWLFDGFEDPLLDFFKKVNSPVIDIPFSKFGWFVDRNGSETYDGRFTMYTGEDDIHKLGELTHWNGKSYTDFYTGNCSIVNGTTGELWPADVDTSETKTLFVTDICRFFTLNPAKPVKIKDVDAFEWYADDSQFDNGHKYKEKACFCPNNTKTNTCEKSGVMDISKCRYGAPAYVSYPHFYLADPSYVDAVKGMYPNKNKHKTTLALQKISGIPLKVNARLQINVLLQPYNDFDFFKNIPTVMMPLFWFTQTVELDDELASTVRLVGNLLSIGTYVAYGVGALGILIIIIGLVLTFTKRWKQRHYDDLDPLTN